jgi:ribosome-interacting GTPase 1
MMWQDVPIQLVDLPAIAHEFLEPWVPGIIRSADAAILVADLGSDDVAEATETVLDRLATTHTELVGSLPFDVDDEAIRHVKTIVVADKLDTPGADDRLAVLRDLFGDRYPILPVSAAKGQGLETIREAAYHLLGVLRVYTKVPGKPVDRSRPVTLPIGSTVLDLARDIHRDFEHSLRFARIWGSGVFDGQTVKRDHELRDCDVIELHVS